MKVERGCFVNKEEIMLKKKMLSVCLIMALILSMNSMVTFAAT